jgi:uridine kinase
MRALLLQHTQTNRASALELAQPRRVILIEGMLLLSDPALRAEIDIKLYVDTDADLR